MLFEVGPGVITGCHTATSAALTEPGCSPSAQRARGLDFFQQMGRYLTAAVLQTGSTRWVVCLQGLGRR